MATFSHINIEESSTITAKAATIAVTRNSSAMHQELISLADPENAASIARISSAAPNSTDAGLVVRTVGAVSIQGNSTVVQGTSPWIIGGNSTVLQGTSPWVVGGTITAVTDITNAVTIKGNSTVVQGTSPWVVSETAMQSSVAPSSGSSGAIVRQVVDIILTVASTNGLAGSTALAIQSSGAAIRSYVTAYSITSTVLAATKLAFWSGSTMIWPVVIQAVSSAMAGANLAVSAPAYLFRTKAAGPLTLNCKGSTIAGFQIAVSYFRAP